MSTRSSACCRSSRTIGHISGLSLVGGLPEVIEHGVSGYLHPPEALDEMAASAVMLLTDEARHRAVATAACRRVQVHFCVERVVPMYEECYLRLAGSR